jgi:hypothetical protein
MSIPTCNKKCYLDFKLDKNDCSKYRIFTRFSKIPLKEGNNVQTLIIKAGTTSTTATVLIQKYINCFDKVSTTIIKDPYVQDFASSCKKYYKSEAAQEIYQTEFDDVKGKKMKRASKRR